MTNLPERSIPAPDFLHQELSHDPAETIKHWYAEHSEKFKHESSPSLDHHLTLLELGYLLGESNISGAHTKTYQKSLEDKDCYHGEAYLFAALHTTARVKDYEALKERLFKHCIVYHRRELFIPHFLAAGHTEAALELLDAGNISCDEEIRIRLDILPCLLDQGLDHQAAKVYHGIEERKTCDWRDEYTKRIGELAGQLHLARDKAKVIDTYAPALIEASEKLGDFQLAINALLNIAPEQWSDELEEAVVALLESMSPFQGKIPLLVKLGIMTRNPHYLQQAARAYKLNHDNYYRKVTAEHDYVAVRHDGRAIGYGARYFKDSTAAAALIETVASRPFITHPEFLSDIYATWLANGDTELLGQWLTKHHDIITHSFGFSEHRLNDWDLVRSQLAIGWLRAFEPIDTALPLQRYNPKTTYFRASLSFS